MKHQSTDESAVERAKEIARMVLDDKCDPLLACRELADLRLLLPGISTDVMDVLVGVASEIDGLPIGPERDHWNSEALKRKDIEAAHYRQRIREAVQNALQELLIALSGGRQ